MSKRCIDLRPICKDRRWRWRYEPSFKAERMNSANPDAPWYVEVICLNGLIYPYGGDELLACIEGHPRIAAKLRAIGPEVCPHQGDVVYRFPLHLLDKVAEVMRPRKKRPGHAAGTAALARYRQAQAAQTALESPETARPIPGVGGTE